MRQLTLRDGRVLDYRTSGPVEGDLLVFFHGTPGACTPQTWLEEAAHARGFRFVAWSRPGYGNSTRSPGRAVVDVVDDAAQVLAMLGEENCYVAGVSGGGPAALACAARLPGARAGLLVASNAPFDAEGLDFLAGMGSLNIEEFKAAVQGETTLRTVLEAESEGMRDTNVDGLTTALDTILPAVDRSVLTADVATSMVAATRESVRSGVDGWLDDDLEAVASWGFDLEEVVVPIAIWQGTEDRMVPITHGKWLADRLPTASAHFVEGGGHLSVRVGAIGAMLEELRSMAPPL